MANGKPMPKTEDEWKQRLTPEQYKVLREKGTEPAFSGQYYATKDKGMYICGACGQELFSSDANFDSGTGWPSFDRPAADGKIKLIEDRSQGMPARPNDFGHSGGVRTEVVCGHCGSHLGHVFDDGPTETCQRFCINSAALGMKQPQSVKGSKK